MPFVRPFEPVCVGSFGRRLGWLDVVLTRGGGEVCPLVGVRALVLLLEVGAVLATATASAAPAPARSALLAGRARVLRRRADGNLFGLGLLLVRVLLVLFLLLRRHARGRRLQRQRSCLLEAVHLLALFDDEG